MAGVVWQGDGTRPASLRAVPGEAAGGAVLGQVAVPPTLPVTGQCFIIYLCCIYDAISILYKICVVVLCEGSAPSLFPM